MLSDTIPLSDPVLSLPALRRFSKIACISDNRVALYLTNKLSKPLHLVESRSIICILIYEEASYNFCGWD